MRKKALAAAAALCLAPTTPALAAWSPPRVVDVPATAATDLAVDRHGDVAVGWASRTAVEATVVEAGRAARTRRLWSTPRSSARGVAAAINPRGEATVAWVAGGTVRAAWRSAAGRWSAPRVAGPGREDPRLAVAADGTVLLTWVANGAGAGPGRVAVAWRAPGHSFGAPRILSRPRLVSTPYLTVGAAPAFDAAGTAYLAAPCDSVVRTARRHSRRFGSVVVVAPAPVLGFSLSVAEAGRGVASWVAGRCTADVATGDAPGRPWASALRAGAFGAPVALSAAPTASS